MNTAEQSTEEVAAVEESAVSLTADVVASTGDSTDVEVAAPVTITMKGNANGRWFKLGPRDARRLGLVEVPGRSCELRLGEGANPNNILILPNAETFTSRELSCLQHKSGDWLAGWQIDSEDPGGYPPQG